jgi:hypothetical protein
MVFGWFWYGFSIVFAWFLHGFGMILASFWYGFGDAWECLEVLEGVWE